MTSENWRGGDRRRKNSRHGGSQPYKRHGETSGSSLHDAGREVPGRGESPKKPEKEYEKSNKNSNERPKWKHQKVRQEAIPMPVCPYCKEPIKDLVCAVGNREGEAAHFECVQKRVAAGETLRKGETVTYIGGGRFGIVTFDNPRNPREFKIKKIIEWEKKDNPIQWRKRLADRFSLT
ncbi:MAG: hypothetical protein LBK66_04700 [Spirochaetaceae bacterium]|jgi:hypothetical protein|nr:hypothetical protein [Spirochaetaceae bacterium]